MDMTSVKLQSYDPRFQQDLRRDIVDFFAFHGGLVGEQDQAAAEVGQACEEILAGWQSGRSFLYVVLWEGSYAGFIRLDYRGDKVAWLEDLYVRPALRNRGIASCAIKLAEEIVAAQPGYTALCMDVVPRNDQALGLYYRLGYDTISLVTLRKEFGQNPRDRRAPFLGREYHV